MGLVLDHLSQAPFGAVDEDGGVDAGDGVEAGNNYVFMAESTWQFLRANRCRRRVGGTQCALHANAEQWDSQSSGTPVGSTYTTPKVRAVFASISLRWLNARPQACKEESDAD